MCKCREYTSTDTSSHYQQLCLRIVLEKHKIQRLIITTAHLVIVQRNFADFIIRCQSTASIYASVFSSQKSSKNTPFHRLNSNKRAPKRLLMTCSLVSFWALVCIEWHRECVFVALSALFCYNFAWFYREFLKLHFVS